MSIKPQTDLTEVADKIRRVDGKATAPVVAPRPRTLTYAPPPRRKLTEEEEWEALYAVASDAAIRRQAIAESV